MVFHIFRISLPSRLFFFICIWGWSVCSPLRAQNDSTARFEPSFVRACVPFTIQINDFNRTQGAELISFVYNLDSCILGNGDINVACLDTVTTHTYTSPGIFRVAQLAQFNNNGNTFGDSATMIVEVLPTPLPNFIIQPCSGREVSLQVDTTGNSYDQYIIVWDDPNDFSDPADLVADTLPRQMPNIRHVYSSIGDSQRQITVRGNYNPGGCGAELSQTITLTPTLVPPEIRSLRNLNLDDQTGSLELSFTSDVNFNYEVLLNGASQGLFPGNDAIIQAQFQNINTLSGPVCVEIVTQDVCGNRDTTEAVFCSLNLNVNAEDGQNRLAWTPYPRTDILSGNPLETFQYIVYRDGLPFFTSDQIGLSTFVDNTVDCNVVYCYQVEAIFQTPSIQFSTISNESCVTGFRTENLPALDILNSTVQTDRTIRLFWEVPIRPSISDYTVDRGDTVFSINVSSFDALDVDVRLENTPCYSVFYQNECGQTAPTSNITCPVFLQGDLVDRGDALLTWSAYQNANNSFLNYIVERRNADGNFESIATLNNSTLSFADVNTRASTQTLFYRIRTLISTVPLRESVSNVIELSQDFKVFFPNAFTPNGDGLNDFFRPEGLFVNDITLSVYHRDGTLLYESSDISEGWDGNRNGQPAPEGAYIFIAKGIDFIGNSFQTQGTFTLIR